MIYNLTSETRRARLPAASSMQAYLSDGYCAAASAPRCRRSLVVLCEYSNIRIESNSYFSIRFDSKRPQLFEIFEFLPVTSFLLV